MPEFAHFLDRSLHAAEPYLVGTAVILWAIGFGAAAIGVWRGLLRRTRPPSPLFVWPCLGFLAIIFSMIGGVTFLSHAARDEVRARLGAAVTELRINGAPARDPERLVSALRQIRAHNYHHSHPTAAYRVQLQTSDGQLELLLRRDSTVPNEYWVFYPEFVQANDIGTIVTDTLD